MYYIRCFCFLCFKVIDVDLVEGDSVEVYDGESREATKIAQYTRSRQGDVLFTTGNSAYLQFTSDLIRSGRGFNVTYQAGKCLLETGSFVLAN